LEFLAWVFGVPGLFASGVLVCSILGVCVTEAVVETFWPQFGNVLWIRIAGGLAGFVFAFVIAIKQLRRPPVAGPEE
jgi:hypothetical protein